MTPLNLVVCGILVLIGPIGWVILAVMAIIELKEMGDG
jgi:hypothetical protein